METSPTRGSGLRDALARSLERRTRGRIYRWLALFAFAGCAALVLTDVIMWAIIPDYDPIQQTVSALAAGPHSWIADSGIVVFALGILALAGGFVLRDDADVRSWLVRISLVLLSLTMILIALWNEYGDDQSGGLVIHPYLVTILGVLVFIVLWFAPARGWRDGLRKAMRAVAVIWAILAGTLDLVPDAIQGLQERILMLIMVAGVAASGWQLMQRPPAG
jgi:hypothetical protein